MRCNNNYTMLVCILIGFILILVISNAYSSCKNNENFYTRQGQYIPNHLWKGTSMDFANCYNNDMYCKEKYYRTPSGIVSMKHFLQCGKPCVHDQDCPTMCPHCQEGICQGRSFPDNFYPQ